MGTDSAPEVSSQRSGTTVRSAGRKTVPTATPWAMWTSGIAATCSTTYGWLAR